MRKRLIAGNWKMNLGPREAVDLMENICAGVDKINCDMMVFPPSIYLQAVLDKLAGAGLSEKIGVGAQNSAAFPNGAYTGEISAQMLAEIGCGACLVGHSERRQYFGETEKDLADKTNRLLEEGLSPVFCFGEELSERRAGNHLAIVKRQITEGLFHLNPEEISKVILAYEPVWAIGTGETATPSQAQEVHQFVRGLMANKYSKAVADNIRILYGGSVKPGNAAELFGQPDIDGALVGGASLVAENFLKICQA